MKNLSSNTAITRVTETLSGIEANDDSDALVFSEDANWIAFITNANNLTTDDYSAAYSQQVIIFDRINHSLSLASKNDLGLPITQAASGGITGVSVSDSGRYVSYTYEDRLEIGDNRGVVLPDFSGDVDGEMDVILFDTNTQTPKIVSKHVNGMHSNDDVEGLTQVVEDLSVTPPLVGVIFQAEGGDLTGLASHPGHREVYLYQQGGPSSGIIFENGFEK